MHEDELALKIADLVMKKIQPLIDEETKVIAMDLQDVDKDITKARSMSFSISLKVENDGNLLVLEGHGKSNLPARELKRSSHQISVAQTGQINLFDQVDYGEGK